MGLEPLYILCLSFPYSYYIWVEELSPPILPIGKRRFSRQPPESLREVYGLLRGHNLKSIRPQIQDLSLFHILLYAVASFDRIVLWGLVETLSTLLVVLRPQGPSGGLDKAFGFQSRVLGGPQETQTPS